MLLRSMGQLACDNCRPVHGVGWYLFALAIAVIGAAVFLAHRLEKGTDRRYPKVFVWIIVAAVVVGTFVSVADLTVTVAGKGTVQCARAPDDALLRGLPNDGALDAAQLGCKHAARHRLESAAFGVGAVSLPLMAVMVMAAWEDRRRLRVVRTSPQIS
jgi:hypothetical protein